MVAACRRGGHVQIPPFLRGIPAPVAIDCERCETLVKFGRSPGTIAWILAQTSQDDLLELFRNFDLSAFRWRHGSVPRVLHEN